MFEIMFVIVPVVAISIFVLTFALILSPKLRGKFMSNQIKATKYMMDESKNDIRDISTSMANATKDGIRITTGAIKDGFTSNYIYCKYCGSSIDGDSRFCKNCGKEQ